MTIWVVRHDDDLYVRSVNGRTAAWFRAAQVRHEGQIWAGGVEKNVLLVETDDMNDEIDAATARSTTDTPPASSTPSSARRREPRR